jgi:probable rRNA maturation factor
VDVIFVSDAGLARLHGRYLGDPRPTDVMAFELGTAGDGPEAEVYVSAERARAVARARGLPPARELALYVIHGCLHLCGFDDQAPNARRRMRRAERLLLSRLALQA